MAFESLEQIVQVCQEKSVSFAEAVILEDQNDRLVTREATMQQMQHIWESMLEAGRSYDENRMSTSGLVGGDGGRMARYAEIGNTLCGDRMSRVIAQALQMGESNACMKRIVAAPTAGACGVLPAVLIPLFNESEAIHAQAASQNEPSTPAQNDSKNSAASHALPKSAHSAASHALSESTQSASSAKHHTAETPVTGQNPAKDSSPTETDFVLSLFVAAGIGQVIATRASIAGASGGCQAEIGSASAMAAGALVFLRGGSCDQISQAVAMSLKNLLGLVCDPVSGLVEVPCVKRNVIGAVNAMSAADMALAGIKSAIPADQVIDAMKEVGDLMDVSLRETGRGGLAATKCAIEITKKIQGISN